MLWSASVIVAWCRLLDLPRHASDPTSQSSTEWPSSRYLLHVRLRPILSCTLSFLPYPVNCTIVWCCFSVIESVNENCVVIIRLATLEPLASSVFFTVSLVNWLTAEFLQFQAQKCEKCGIHGIGSCRCSQEKMHQCAMMLKSASNVDSKDFSSWGSFRTKETRQPFIIIPKNDKS